MKRLIILLTFLMFIASTIAASPPSFCKCTCFTNSTIIPLSSHSTTSSTSSDKPPRAASVGCATCNKAFCLSQRLPICKDAEEKDVLTTCFQRDSRKDQIVVLTFIAGTLGLLVWAGVRKIAERGRVMPEGASGVNYVPVGRS
ncbi:hypothetical protein LZ554_005088 [Drepanopeziza brunnea f. sp. 'monogermtubi']|nr:hypothetical protein LZ554_005088 [Drepanopeziza brunnea f. sp. 'monogermtubi']